MDILNILSSSVLCEMNNWFMHNVKKNDHGPVKYSCACLQNFMENCLYHWTANGFHCLFFSFNRHLLSLPLSLSEEELLKMRQEFHCCFSQVDSSLALPKIRARTLLQVFELEQRDAELLKVDQNLAMTNKQVGTVWDRCGDGWGVHTCIHSCRPDLQVKSIASP